MSNDGLTGETLASWWHALFNSAEEALVICDREGEVRDFNRRAQRFFRGEGEGLSIYPCFTEQTGNRLKKILEQGRPQCETLPAVSFLPGGELRTIVDLGISRLDREHWLLTLKDASRRWRMESHVHRLMTALDATPDVFFLTDAEYKITYVNAAFQTATGHNIEETLGRSAEFLRASASHGVMREYLAAVEAGTEWTGELLNQRRDGTVYPVEATIAPIFDRQGSLLGYVASERDITAKKRLERELISQRNYSRSILHSMDAAVYAVDREFRLRQVNETWRCQPSGYGWLELEGPPEEGAPLLDYVRDAGKRVELKLALESVLRTGEATELCGGRNGGYWSVKISPWTHDGETAGLIYQVSDQTGLKELQNALYQAQKLKTIGSLAAGIAHDFNNLLLVIRGNTTLLTLAQEDREASRKYLGNIEQASARAADITQQLLAFSRASQENISVFDFNGVIEEVAQLAGRSMNSNVRVRLGPSEKPVKVRMDPSRAHQVVLNLVVNAQDAMPDGGVVEICNEMVELSPRQAAKTDFPAGAPFLRCSVKDTGLGIPEEVLPRIFDPFFTTKETGSGTGLGLSIVHGVVSQAGGFVEVESEVERGTVFHVYLPTVDSEVTLKRDPEQELPRCAGRVLVVEDIDLVLDFTCDFLTEIGFEAYRARNAEEALRVLGEQEIDLMLTDYNMPGVSGLELITRVRERWPGIQCILASGYLDEPVERKVKEELKAGTLRKPYNVVEAAEMISTMLNRENALTAEGAGVALSDSLPRMDQEDRPSFR